MLGLSSSDYLQSMSLLASLAKRSSASATFMFRTSYSSAAIVNDKPPSHRAVLYTVRSHAELLDCLNEINSSSSNVTGVVKLVIHFNDPWTKAQSRMVTSKFKRLSADVYKKFRVQLVGYRDDHHASCLRLLFKDAGAWPRIVTHVELTDCEFSTGELFQCMAQADWQRLVGFALVRGEVLTTRIMPHFLAMISKQSPRLKSLRVCELVNLAFTLEMVAMLRECKVLKSLSLQLTQSSLLNHHRAISQAVCPTALESFEIVGLRVNNPLMAADVDAASVAASNQLDSLTLLIQRSPKLKRLAARKFFQSNPSLTAAPAWTSFAKALRESLVDELNLSENPFGPEGAVAIAGWLPGDISLTHLRMSHCGFGHDGWIIILHALRNNYLIRVLECKDSDAVSLNASAKREIARCVCVQAPIMTLAGDFGSLRVMEKINVLATSPLVNAIIVLLHASNEISAARKSADGRVMPSLNGDLLRYLYEAFLCGKNTRLVW